MTTFRYAKYDSSPQATGIDDPSLVVSERQLSPYASSLKVLNPIAKAILLLASLIPITLQPLPAKRAVATATGATFYVDPTWGGPFNGTFTQPYAAPSSATLAAGDQLLFKAGTTTNIASHLVPTVTGSESNRIIYGVYDPSTGQRLMDVVGAASIVSTSAFGAVFIMGSGRNYICVDGLKLSSTAANTFGVVDANGGTHMEVTNCEIFSTGAYGIKAYGVGHVFQGNTIRNNNQSGIYVLLNTGTDSDAVMQYNDIRDNIGYGVFVEDVGGSSGQFTGTIAANTCYNNGDRVFGRAGIGLFCGKSTAKVFRNTVSRSPGGINFSGVGAAKRDYSGALIENNDISFCEFGISADRVRGSWIVQFNRITNSGSYEGTTWVTSFKYGRAIELYGLTAPVAVSDGIVRYNYISGSYNWLTDCSEGVGIGLDNNTTDVTVHSNYIEYCEGNGIQVNRGFGNKVFSNILVDNFTMPASRGATPTSVVAAQIFYIGNPWLRVFNNTCIYTGRTNRQYQNYGIGEIDSELSVYSQVYNNFIEGATIAGLSLSTKTNATAESYNVIADCPALSVNCLTGFPRTAGTGTQVGNENSADASSPFYLATIGGKLDSRGTRVPGDCVAFSGASLAINTPIGASHASFLN